MVLQRKIKGVSPLNWDDWGMVDLVIWTKKKLKLSFIINKDSIYRILFIDSISCHSSLHLSLKQSMRLWGFQVRRAQHWRREASCWCTSQWICSAECRYLNCELHEDWACPVAGTQGIAVSGWCWHYQNANLCVLWMIYELYITFF